MTINRYGTILVVSLIAYIAVCFGLIAGKHGKNPWLFGLLSVVSPFNLAILGYWAFFGEKRRVGAAGDKRPRD